ncbi:MAG: hypothetical protein WCR70_03785 [Sphaerochaetaceae bacterium]
METKFEVTLEQEEVMRQAIRTWGKEKQDRKTVEELSELTKAICKDNEDSKIEEIADVFIMLWQQAEMCGWDNVNGCISYKLGRLDIRLNASYAVDTTGKVNHGI